MKRIFLLFVFILAVSFSACNRQNVDGRLILKQGVLTDEYLNIYLGQISLSRMDIGQVDIPGNN